MQELTQGIMLTKVFRGEQESTTYHIAVHSIKGVALSQTTDHLTRDGIHRSPWNRLYRVILDTASPM